jgi:hypothetical protein
MPNAADALDQLRASGYLPDHCDVLGSGVVGVLTTPTITRLIADSRFANGVLYGLHRDVGAHLQDFRSFSGTFGRGSLQIVVDHQTGRFYSDIDVFNPYEDLIGFFGHAFAEVVPHGLKAWWKG